MIRQLLFASVFAGLSGVASAADLPSMAPAPEALPVPDGFTWTGAYVGLNAGYHWGGSDLSFTGTDTNKGGLGSALDNGAIPSDGPGGANGFIGGGQVGYNWQISRFILGVELDVDGATGRDSVETSHGIDVGFVPTSFKSSESLEWLATLRGRVGWTPIDRFLIFGTGGLAFGESRASFKVTAPTADPPLSVSESISGTVGWAAGGGFEYALPHNWSFKTEYLHYDLGSSDKTATYVYAPNTSTLTGRIQHDGNIVRAGVNFRFD